MTEKGMKCKPSELRVGDKIGVFTVTRNADDIGCALTELEVAGDSSLYNDDSINALIETYGVIRKDEWEFEEELDRVKYNGSNPIVHVEVDLYGFDEGTYRVVLEKLK